MLTIDPDKVCHIVVKARALDAGLEFAGDDPDSALAGEAIEERFDEETSDATGAELAAFIDGLNVDEQLDLMALTWLGRGEFASFAEARKEAQDMRDKHIPTYLKGTPKLGDFLEEGLAQLGISLEDFEKNRL